jgi:hypothetical protein
MTLADCCATVPPQLKPSFVGELTISLRYGVVVNPQVNCQRANGRQFFARTETTGNKLGAQTIGNLLIRRHS